MKTEGSVAQWLQYWSCKKGDIQTTNYSSSDKSAKWAVTGVEHCRCALEQGCSHPSVAIAVMSLCGTSKRQLPRLFLSSSSSRALITIF